jgi:ribonuclease P protein component
MKKKYRLLKNQDFKSVLDIHKSVSRENAAIYHKINDLGHCRVGVSVSSKIGNSVVRHKIKRQVTNMLDKCVPLDCGIDLIVIVRKKYTEK